MVEKTTVVVIDSNDYLPGLVPGFDAYMTKFSSVATKKFLLINLEAQVAGSSEKEIITASTVELPGTSAVKVRIVSTSADDTSDGTGVRKIKIFGLDANGEWVINEVTMNGITEVKPTHTYLHLCFAYATEYGSGGVAAGDITIYEDSDTPTDTYRTISTGAKISDGKILFELDKHRVACLLIGGVVETSAADIGVYCPFSIIDTTTNVGQYEHRCLHVNAGAVQDFGNFRIIKLTNSGEFIPYAKRLHTSDVTYDIKFLLVNH